jgi:hypothetical protein
MAVESDLMVKSGETLLALDLAGPGQLHMPQGSEVGLEGIIVKTQPGTDIFLADRPLGPEQIKDPLLGLGELRALFRSLFGLVYSPGIAGLGFGYGI